MSFLIERKDRGRSEWWCSDDEGVASEWVRDLDEADQYHIRSAAEKDCAMVQAKTKATLTVVERPVKKGK